MDHEPPATDAAPPERFVAAAARIGERLVRGASWAGARCTWLPDHAGAADPPSPSPLLYDGTAGIALFLAELSVASPDPEIARTGRGALRFAIDGASLLPETSFGFHTGRVGVAYAAVRAGIQLGMDLRDEAEALLRPLGGREREDGGLDVIAGAAGAIPALLWLSDHLDPDLTTAMASRLGKHLASMANRHPGGWSWGVGPAAARPLCGYSHGASGMAHAFLELYHRTGDGEHRYAAEQALLYESGFFSAEHGNWPDFRNREIGELLGSGRVEALRERWRTRADTSPPPAYRSFWCHGAPGIGLVRLRAYQLLGTLRYLEEARNAIRTTIASLTAAPINYSLCHGVAGNCETLLLGARLLDEGGLRRHAADAALRGIRRYEDAERSWPCGTLDGRPDPGLLLGEAGIGLFLLRLAHPGIESVLLLTPPDVRRGERERGDAGYRSARSRAIGEHFGRTLRLFEGFGIAPEALLPPYEGAGPRETSDVALAHAAICARIESEPGRRELLDDAFRLDRERYALLLAQWDATEEFLETLARPPVSEIDWETGRFALSPRTRIVASRYDWDGWRLPAGGRPPERGETLYLLHRSGGRVLARALAPLPAAVLHELRTPASLDGVTDSVADALAAEPGTAVRSGLRARVREQLGSAYQSGFVVEYRELP